MNYIYQNYHKHSERTNPIISDSTVSYRDYAEAAKKLGQSILSSAEHGYQGRYVETYDIAREFGLKCLIGAEAYWVRNRFAPDDSNCHVWIGAKNENGRQALNDILSEANLTGFYRRPRIDVPLILSLPKDDVWITSACFVPGTRITTKNSIKNIEDIESGDIVLSHTGAWRKVLYPTKREYVGKIYSIKAEGCYERINCTKDHKFPVVQKAHCGIKEQIVWKRAEELSLADRFLCAINEDMCETRYLDVDEYTDYHALTLNKDTGKHLKNPISVRKIPIDKSLLLFLGLYAAEGNCCASRCNLTFTLHEDESRLVEYIRSYVESISDAKVSVIRKKGSKAVSVYVYCKELSILVSNLIKDGADKKVVPSFVKELPKELQMYFIKGLFLGDGHIKKDRRRITYVTVSESLAKGACYLLERNGIKCSLGIRKEKIDKNNVHHKKAYALDINGIDVVKSFTDFLVGEADYVPTFHKWKVKNQVRINGVSYITKKIRAIDTYDYEGTVHCMNVEIDHSFHVDGIAAHNCVAYWKYADIDSITEDLATHFGKNFFLEVQYHNTESQKQINSHILSLHNKLKIPLIMGCDSHYITADQSQTRDDFLLSKGIKYEDEEGWFLDVPDGQAAYNRFAAQNVLSHADITDAIANTNVFLDVEEYDSPVFNTDIKLPTLYDGEHEIDGVKLPKLDQQGRDEEYKKLVWQGWNEYKDKVPEDQWPKYEKEIQYEIDNVLECHMSDYFIDDYYIMKRGKELGGWLTLTGRGSGVSFFTNKLLGFTDVDRIAAKVKMYPERFMTAERILASGSLPDLDMNVADQEPFAQAQREILGEDHAYPMIAYGTYQKSAAWKLYAKAKGVPFETANAVSEQLKKYENAVKHADEEDKDTIDVLDYIDDQFREIYEDSKDYMGLITSWSIAPCGFLLYQGSIRREVGLIRIKDHLCCLMDGLWAEKNHFLKNDLLKVSVVDLIYRSYHRAGLEPPPQQELLKMLPAEDCAWSLYKTGCTLGLNQVEQPGTSSRVGKYAPTNISELCAFIAAIRPGFKSMYKTFESRDPFDYGVKQFDDLIQTEEMPNSFVLYQEQTMAVLNYAGIPMSECYTAIKNIAKKRAEKVLAYKDTFISGFSKKIAEEGVSETEATALSGKLWQIIEDSSAYSFNASHSYCVSLDSVYSAWIKAHHHLAFYETLLQIQEAKGDKDKMVEIKREAEEYFKVSFPPYRFGQDNREIRANFETNEINNSIKAIKGLPKVTGDLLWTVAEQHPKSMTDTLFLCKQHKVSDAAIENLAKISFFSPFGNDVEILRIIKLYHFFSEGTAKKIKRDKIENRDILKILSKYATDTNAKGEELSQWSITSPGIQSAEAKIKAVKAKLKPYKDTEPPADLAAELESAVREEEQLRLTYEQQMLNEMEQYILSIRYDDLDFRNKMANQMEILGYVDLTTGREEDRRKLLIEDVQPIKDQKTGKPWCYRIDTRSIGSGKSARLSVKPNVFEETPLRKGDTIFTPPGSLKKNQKGYWYLHWYDMVYC